MEKSILMSGLEILSPAEMKSARVTPKENTTNFYAIDFNKVAAVFVDFRDAWGAEEAHMDLIKIKHALRSIGGKDVSIEIKPEKTIITSDTQEFEIKNLNLKDAPTVYRGKLNLPAKATLPREDFVMFLKAAKQISDNFILTITPDDIKFYTRNTDNDEAELYLPKDMLYELDAEKEYRAMYPTNWVLRFADRMNSEKIHLAMETDFPIRIAMENEYYSATAYVAPQMEKD